MPLTFRSNWLDRASSHAINKQPAIVALFGRALPSILNGDSSWAAEVRAAALSKDGETVEVYAGIHQDKYFSNTARDQTRIDQSHFNVVYKGAARHVYVQPNLRGEYEITEITGP